MISISKERRTKSRIKMQFIVILLFHFFIPFILTSFFAPQYAFSQQTEAEKKYKEELMRLQKEIEMLKLKVLETKKSLKVFEDMILLGTLTGTKITVYYKNELKDADILEIAVVLDGFEVSQIKEKDKIDRAKKERILIYDESEAIPGKHIIDVVFTIKGEKLFKKTIRYEFDVEKNIATEINVTTKRASGSKEEKSPQDIDIIVRSEKVKLISR